MSYIKLFQIIPPLGNTSFDVVFLGREEGELKSHLFIHTSEGSFKYQVIFKITNHTIIKIFLYLFILNTTSSYN